MAQQQRKLRCKISAHVPSEGQESKCQVDVIGEYTRNKGVLTNDPQGYDRRRQRPS